MRRLHYLALAAYLAGCIGVLLVREAWRYLRRKGN